MNEPAPILEARGVTKRFGALLASDDVSLALFPGEIHALIGPNGAGKSTLIKQITGELRPDDGSIYLDGRDISTLTTPKRAMAGLARSFQISALALEFSALQNVALAIAARDGGIFQFFKTALREAALVDEARVHLARVGLAGRADTATATLSHGERRLLEVALALAMKPKVFLLDEPMAGLGHAGSKELTRLLDGLRREAPILLVEHDVDAVFQLADRISVLVYGRIIATGASEEIRANAEVREAYLGAEEAAAAI